MTASLAQVPGDSVTGFIFPGQGSQAVGMLADLAGGASVARQTFDEASTVLGYDLWALCRDGPEERLNETEQTQPAMLAAGVATWRAWVDAGGSSPRAVAGHSLGEYSALVAAGAMPFADALGAVLARARAMQAAVPAGRGGIAAILGLDDGAAEAVCAQVNAARTEPGVWAVNYNAPGQVVLAGYREAVDAAIEAARAAGARRAIALAMSVPVHCPLMAPAATALTQALDAASISSPAVPVVHNADLASHAEAGAIRNALVGQLTRPVRWTDTVHRLAELGCERLVELGPGRVLAGLVKRARRDLPCVAVHDSASLAKALS